MRYIFSFILAFIITIPIYAVNAFVELKKFNTAENKSFVELQLMIPGTSLNYVEKEAGQFQAAVEVLILIKQKEEIAAYDKYILNSEMLEANQYVNLLDIKRFSLDNGSYNLEISFTDVSDAEKKKEIQQAFEMDFSKDEITLSDITLAQKIEKQEVENLYSKSGYEVIPNVINFFSGENSELGFYAEIYGADKIIEEDAYMISYAVMDEGLSEVIKGLRKFKKATPAPVEVVMAVFNIDDLPSGNYQFSIEVRNKKNELLANKTTQFQRSKPVNAEEAIANITNEVNVANTFVEDYTDVDSLDFYLGSLMPIVDHSHHKIIINAMNSLNVEVMQQVMYNYLSAIFPTNTEAEFNLYKKVVLTVHDKYQTLTSNGHETDRGRFFLQYGKPTEIIVGNESGSLPYEIWTYNRVAETNQSDVKTIFYNPDIASNYYPVLHSEIRGEILNEYWKTELYTSDVKSNFHDVDNKDRQKTYGERAIDAFDEYNLPRNTGSKTGGE